MQALHAYGLRGRCIRKDTDFGRRQREEVFTTENGVLSIKLPAEDWKEITDPTRWVVLSNGVDMITIDHFSNGEKLPDITVADSHYTNVYEAIYSTQNEVFLITGFVANEESITEVCNAIMSVKVLKYNTKQAVKKVAVEAKQFTIREINKTFYVTSDGVNVRSGCSVSDPIIGGLHKGNAVNVRGRFSITERITAGIRSTSARESAMSRQIS